MLRDRRAHVARQTATLSLHTTTYTPNRDTDDSGHAQQTLGGSMVTYDSVSEVRFNGNDTTYTLTVDVAGLRFWDRSRS